MNICLSENIRLLRKQRSMLQEQLAEALGVSIAAVSKWERGAATPDLNYIIDMANLFGVSIDALIGFRMQGGTADGLEERISMLQRSKDYTAAAAEAEKALIRYPNDFRIVYRCAEMYQLRGIETGDAASTENAVALYDRAIELLPQNDNPDISEVLIRMETAQCLLTLGKEDEGLDMLRQCNTYGVNNALIGYTLALSKAHDPKEAAPYLSSAFTNCLQTLVHTLCGYANLFMRQGHSDAALDALLWLVRYLESLKTDGEKTCYVDKLLAPFYAECARITGQNSMSEESAAYLRRAYELAVRFDADPTFSMHNLRFCAGDTKDATAFDSMGHSALSAVENQLRGESCTAEILQAWEALRQSKS